MFAFVSLYVCTFREDKNPREVEAVLYYSSVVMSERSWQHLWTYWSCPLVSCLTSGEGEEKEVGSMQSYTSSLEPRVCAQPLVCLPWVPGHLVLRRECLIVLDRSALSCLALAIECHNICDYTRSASVAVLQLSWFSCFSLYNPVLCVLGSITIQITVTVKITPSQTSFLFSDMVKCLALPLLFYIHIYS